MNGGKWGGRKTAARITAERKDQAMKHEIKYLKTEPDSRDECYFHDETMGCRLVECSCDKRGLARVAGDR